MHGTNLRLLFTAFIEGQNILNDFVLSYSSIIHVSIASDFMRKAKFDITLKFPADADKI